MTTIAGATDELQAFETFDLDEWCKWVSPAPLVRLGRVEDHIAEMENRRIEHIETAAGLMDEIDRRGGAYGDPHVIAGLTEGVKLRLAAAKLCGHQVRALTERMNRND